MWAGWVLTALYVGIIDSVTQYSFSLLIQMAMALRLTPVLVPASAQFNHFGLVSRRTQFRVSAATMAADGPQSSKVIDSHLHVWASPKEVPNSGFYFVVNVDFVVFG